MKVTNKHTPEDKKKWVHLSLEEALKRVDKVSTIEEAKEVLRVLTRLAFEERK